MVVEEVVTRDLFRVASRKIVKATLKEVIGYIMISSDVRLFPKLCPLYSIIVDYDLCVKIGIIIHQSQM